MALVPFWFILITILWTGFFILEGFDLGVGMLHAVVGRDEAGRRAVINTIGPLWDGNEVWLIVAGAAMFAAFPGWYATMFSGMYLALVILLCGLILRGVSFEYRGKDPSRRWRGFWSWALIAGSFIVPLVIGIALGDLLHGLPIDSSHEYTGTFWDLFQPYAILTGIMLVSLCLLHGATFITMKTTDELRRRAWRIGRQVSPVTGLLVLAWVAWTHVSAHEGAFLNIIELIAALSVLAAVWEVWGEHQGLAFTATTVTIASCIVTLFVDLYPNLMVSSTNPAYSLTAHNSASPSYTLNVMTVVSVILLPVVLAYTAWTYYVFRRRVSASQFRPAAAAPMPRGPSDTSGPQAVAAGSRSAGTAPGTAPASAQAPAPAGSRRGRHRHWRGGTR